ncbi:MAG: hypothetical protein WAL29_09270 [Bacteroidales bacterium]
MLKRDTKGFLLGVRGRGGRVGVRVQKLSVIINNCDERLAFQGGETYVIVFLKVKILGLTTDS